jgi:hypothetical protein
MAEEVAALVLRRFLRGGTWEALAREIAWEAVRSSGVEHACVDWLSKLVEARLSDRVDGFEFLIEQACLSGRRDHLRMWPGDLPGAETAAVLEGREEAAQVLSRFYLDLLDWATGVLSDRVGKARASDRQRLPPPRRERPPSEIEVPGLVAEELTRIRERFGWPGDRAA